jgi:hypothetical protein
VYLSKAQINITQKFLDKYANTELDVFENLYDDILLLNILSDQRNFEEFLTTHDSINRNKADNCTQSFQTYSEYYLNRLRSLKNIQLYVDRIFQKSSQSLNEVRCYLGISRCW